MKLKLTPSYYLTDELGDTPRVVHRQTGDAHGPDDVAQLYPSWGMQPVRQSVRRAAAILKLSADESAMVSRFVGPGRPSTATESATGHIHLRVTMERKNRYVRAGKLAGKNLSDWITGTCDAASSE